MLYVCSVWKLHVKPFWLSYHKSNSEVWRDMSKGALCSECRALTCCLINLTYKEILSKISQLTAQKQNVATRRHLISHCSTRRGKSLDSGTTGCALPSGADNCQPTEKGFSREVCWQHWSGLRETNPRAGERPGSLSLQLVKMTVFSPRTKISDVSWLIARALLAVLLGGTRFL